MKKLTVSLFLLLAATAFFECSNLMAQSKSDFFKEYDLFYFDVSGNFKKNGHHVDKGGEQFTPDILYSDGSFLSSYCEHPNQPPNPKASSNQWEIFFQGHVYRTYYGSDNAIRDGALLYYLKCEKDEYIEAAKRNCCIETALYVNDTRIDYADMTDIEARIGSSAISPLFVKDGILYYAKTVGDKTNYYSYNPVSQIVSPFRPELFASGDNELLGILDNGDIIFDDSTGIFRNTTDSRIISGEHIGSLFIRGLAVGNHYYCFTAPTENGPHGFIKDNLLVADIRSDTYGRTIDADEQDCHFGNYIYGYLTPMQYVTKEGTIVRIDKATTRVTHHGRGEPPFETDVVYFVDNHPINFSRYWKIGGTIRNGIQNLSFLFDKEGKVHSIVVTALDDNLVPNIYLVHYLGEGRIGSPEILLRDATLFGVAKKVTEE